MPAEHARYLAKYLSKDRPACLKRWRLWAAFGDGWEPTKVKDLIKESLFQHGLSGLQGMAGMVRTGPFLRAARSGAANGVYDHRAGLESGPGAIREAVFDV
jgi:hypothetical protein